MDLNWLAGKMLSFTKKEKETRKNQLDKWVEENPDCIYEINDNINRKVEEKPKDKHKFTATEKITLDYEGEF
tara:strand:+ start:1584 stop:1799 length:216 start_codon:yes stop_codon:yes gene_type:complete